MRQLLAMGLLAAGLLGSVSSEAQYNSEKVTIKWSKTFGNNTNDRSNVICRVKHDYLVGGASYNAKAKISEARLFKLDVNGTRAWEKSYPDKFTGEITHIIPSVKGGAIVAMQASDKKYRRIRVMRISDTDGSIYWQTDISFKESITPAAIVENADGDVFVAYNRDYEPTKDDYYINVGLSKINPSGVLEWSNTFQYNYDESVVNMLPNYKGEFVLLTNVMRTENGVSKDYYRINTINQNGKIANTNDLEWLKGSKIYVSDFAVDEKNRVALVGDNSKAEDLEPLVVLIDDQGKKVWQADWSLDLFPKEGNDISFDTRGNVIVVGEVENWLNFDNEDDTNMWIAKLGTDGTLLWEKEIGGSFQEEAKSVALGAKGEIIVVGSTAYSLEGDTDMSIIELVEDMQFSGAAPKVWAVIVGVADYSDTRNKEGCRDLSFSDDDAKIMYEFLRGPQGGALPDAQIRMLIDSDATYDKILAACDELFSQAAPQDLILFYFSGHGGVEKFCGHDQNISHASLKKIIAKSPALKRLCIADACHSGSWNSNNQISEKTQLSDAEMQQLYYQQLGRTGDGLALFMSSSMEETSLELPGLGHGLFTHFYIEGLKGEADKNKDKIITIDELYQFVYSSVSKKASHMGSSQTPQINGAFDKDMPVGVVR